MGAWSHEPFGNDTACDWKYDLIEADDLSVIEKALAEVNDCSEYLETYIAERGIAAAEVLAHLVGRGTHTDSYTDEITIWISKHRLIPSRELLGEGVKALNRIKADQSELKESWAESGSFDEWTKSLNAIKEVLIDPLG